MSKTYHVIITVVAPEGWEFEPYDLDSNIDEVFGKTGAEIVNIAQTEDKD